MVFNLYVISRTKTTHLTTLSGKHILRLRVMELDIEKSNGTNTCKGLIQCHRRTGDNFYIEIECYAFKM